tara:strand:+ start:2178 stop:3476 length:1299 start_codon:yes stop_codon:yes gene_type:complete
MNINNLIIDTSEMPSVETVRKITIAGDINAKFQLIILQNPTSSSTHTLYYDFKSNAFESGYNDVNNSLVITMKSSVFTKDIVFPSGGGEYVIKLITFSGTTVNNSRSNVITKSISKQAASATLTFQAATINTNKYETFATTTASGPLGSSGGELTIDFDATNNNDDLHGFGLFGNPSFARSGLVGGQTESTAINHDQAWYFETTENVVTNVIGDGADSTTILVADATDLVVGMELKFYKGTTAPENAAGDAVPVTVTLTSITIEDTNVELRFSEEVGFDEGETMTFRAYGTDLINNATGALLTFNSINVTPEILQKTVRLDSDGDFTTSTTITLNNTLGLAVNPGNRYRGQGVDNSSDNRITSITADADGTGGNGAIVVQLTQLLRKGTVLDFDGTFAVVNFATTVNIDTFPNANRTINFDIDKFLSIGAGS